MVGAGSNHFSEEEMQLSEKLCVNCFISMRKLSRWKPSTGLEIRNLCILMAFWKIERKL